MLVVLTKRLSENRAERLDPNWREKERNFLDEVAKGCGLSNDFAKDLWQANAQKARDDALRRVGELEAASQNAAFARILQRMELGSSDAKTVVTEQDIRSVDWKHVSNWPNGRELTLHSDLLGDLKTQWAEKAHELRFEITQAPRMWIAFGSKLANELLSGNVKPDDLERRSPPFELDKLIWLNLQTAGSVKPIADQLHSDQIVQATIRPDGQEANLGRLRESMAGVKGRYLMVTGHVEGEWFVSKFAGKEQFRVTQRTLDEASRLAGATPFLVACNLGDVTGTGPMGIITPRQVAQALKYADALDFDDLQQRRAKPGLTVAGRTQFANDLFAVELAERVRGTALEVTCVFPGVARTRVFQNARGLPWFMRLVGPLMHCFGHAAESAARTPVFLASDASAR